MPPASSRLLERSLTEEIRFGRPADQVKVFVSAKMSDHSLVQERKAAIKEIDALPPHTAWAWEKNAAAGPYYSLRVCVSNARTSEALILIVADELTEPTKKEYTAAKHAKVPRFIFLKQGVSRTTELSAFIERERKTAITAPFRNLSELRTQIRYSLQSYTADLYRSSILAARGLL